VRTTQKETELVSNVTEAFRRGSQKASNQASPYQYFGLASNPFDNEYVIKHPDLISDGTRSTLARLAERAGFAVQAKTHMLLIGPEGAGRTLLLKLLAQTLNQSMGNNFAVFVDASGVWSGSVSDQVRSGIGGFQAWLSTVDFQVTRLVLLDNADSSINGIIQSFNQSDSLSEEPPVTVCSVSYPTYRYAMREEPLSKTFKVHLSVQEREKPEIERMLRTSVASCRTSSDPFDDGAYKSIASYSLGLPGLAADLSTFCLQYASGVGLSQISRKTVEKIATALSFGRALSLMQGAMKLEGTKADIASRALQEFYLNNEIRRSELLSAFSNLARSTLAYHFKDLINDEILASERFGFRVRYEIPKPVRSALQLIENRSDAGAGPRDHRIMDTPAMRESTNSPGLERAEASGAAGPPMVGAEPP
jgi:energy-coupling factor transporter ATP-binding protein EcfA2